MCMHVCSYFMVHQGCENQMLNVFQSAKDIAHCCPSRQTSYSVMLCIEETNRGKTSKETKRVLPLKQLQAVEIM